MRRTAIALALVISAGLIVAITGPRHASDAGARWIRADGAAPRIIAHAGGLALFPANTMAAFSGAAALGVDVLEMDVQLTADGELVTLHDATVDRTTDGTGPVRSLTRAEVLALDASHGWRSEDGSDPFGGVRVPPADLDAVFARFAGTGLDFVVELKNDGADGEIAARRLAELIRRHGIGARVIVCSFHARTLAAFRTASAGSVATSGTEGEIRTALIAGRFDLGGFWYRPGPVSVLQVPVSAAGLDLAAVEVVDGAHRHGQAVEYWTVNDAQTMDRLIANGADGIMTDDPALLRARLAARGLALPDPVAVGDRR